MAAMDPKKTPSKSKETSGLLMSIIRTLSSSADVHQREEEKARLEKAYKESDRKLDKLLTEHLSDTSSILGAFSNINNRIQSSQDRIKAIKDNLQSCKNLLHCKRDELRKLWIEGIEHKTVAAMLDQIEQVKDVSGKLQSHIEKKHYLHATDLLVKSVSLLEGDLAEVEALRDVKMELLAKKEELHELLIDELHKQIYIKSTSSVVKGFQRQGSLRQSKKDKTSLVKQVLTQSTQGEEYTDHKLASLQSVSLEDVAKPQSVTEDVNVDPEDEPVHFIAILIECLAQLRKLPEAIDAIRSRIKPGLLAIVQRASQQVADNAYFEGENLEGSNQSQYLLELLELILLQFKIVAHTHQIVLANLTRVKIFEPVNQCVKVVVEPRLVTAELWRLRRVVRCPLSLMKRQVATQCRDLSVCSMACLGDFCLYDAVEVWTKIQAVLQLFLSDYLDIRNTASTQTQGPTNFDEPTTDLGAYFTRKRATKPKKFALFRFDASSHAISMNSYLREQRQEFYGSGDILTGGDEVGEVNKTQFVCKPGASNITVIYNIIMKFIKEIEVASKLAPGTCTLQAFITEFIKNIFLGQVLYNIQNSIDSATKGFDAQRILIDMRSQREVNVSKPLLQSTFIVAKRLEELKNLMHQLPDYADQFLNMICKILQEYKDTCHACYRGIVLSDSDERRTISATWAKDEDINRFLRTLPNWQNLKEEHATAQIPEISEEDMRVLNSKESSILTSNLSSTDCLIPQQEIITDVIHLRTLGNLGESLEWFSGQIKILAENFSKEKHIIRSPHNSPTHHFNLSVSESTLGSLLSLATDFQELGELCLLVLHLEVRVHCFYHLMPVATQSNYSGAIDDMDPDANVIKLNKDLQAMEEVMTQSLQPPKFKYIYEGLGHLVSSILINSTQYFKRINENGIKKMCRNIFAVQQCLTNITSSRESDLDHARQYYELLYLTPDEILSIVLDKGARYTELEYVNLLNLLARSRPGTDPEKVMLVLQRLTDFMKKNPIPEYCKFLFRLSFTACKCLVFAPLHLVLVLCFSRAITVKPKVFILFSH